MLPRGGFGTVIEESFRAMGVGRKEKPSRQGWCSGFVEKVNF